MKMGDKFCFECGGKCILHEHHVVPRVLGGVKTITLCVSCHGKVHSRDFTHHKNLQKIGIQKAKENGVRFGRPKALSTQDELNFYDDVVCDNLSTKELAEKYNISEPTARRRRSEIINEKNTI
jgi:hypothetical protein